MNMNKFRLTVVAASLAVGVFHAAASPLLIDASGIASDSLLSNSTYTGQFNGASQLSQPFQINSASFSFTFTDNNDPLIVGAKSTNSIITSGDTFTSSDYNGWDYSYYYLRTQTAYNSVNQTYAGESASVALGSTGINVGSGSTSSSQSISTSTSYLGQTYLGSSGNSGYYYSYSCGNYGCSGYQPGNLSYYYQNNYENLTTTTNNQTGTFNVSGTISDAGLLGEILNNKTLDFSLGVQGNLFLSSAQLRLDTTLLEITSNNVPEPESGLLMLTALGALGLITRRRFKK